MSRPTDLRAILAEQGEITERLLARLADPSAEPADVLNLLDSLALIEQKRAPLVDAYRERASLDRRREEERSIRQYVLRALDEIGVPQTAGFLEDYLYARELVLLKTRGVGALRRDEYRAWDRLRRSGRPRVAYIVPCLDEDGVALPRWMARSDWPLRARVFVAGIDELWETHRVCALIDAYREAEPDDAPRFLPLIEQYAAEVFGDEMSAAELDQSRWLDELRASADATVAKLERSIGSALDQAAARLEQADEAKQLWGGAVR